MKSMKSWNKFTTIYYYKRIFLIISILISIYQIFQCKYTGGYNIVKGSKAIKEIKEKITSYSSIGSLYLLTSFSSFTCPSSASASVVTETEPNNTYKNANKLEFPTEAKTTKFKGTIETASEDYDIFYMAVPSDTTYTKIYHKANKSLCSILLSSDDSELSNDSANSNESVTTYIEDIEINAGSTNIQPSQYIFFFCLTFFDNYSYEVEISVTDLESTSTSFFSADTFTDTESTLSSVVFGPTVFEISAGIEKNKYYTQTSLDECLKRLKKTIPAASMLDAYNLLLYTNCGASSYTKINPYFIAGYECDLEEVDWIQIDDLGIP